MRRRFPLFAVVFASLFLAACQPAPSPQDIRSVTVNGEGELSVAPEIATVQLAVEARGKELAQAQQQAGEVTTAVLALVAELGIAKENVQSTQLRVHPEFDWHEGRQTLRGYLVQRDIRVDVEDLAKLGPLLERAMQAGVNNIVPPELKVRDPRALHREVLAFAAADAKANAQALAQSLDATLGEARRITAIEVMPPQPMMYEMQAMRAKDAGAAEQSYETGRITVRASVQAEFELR